MARKRKRRAAAATTTQSKLAAKETMAITSLSLSAGLPVLQKSKKNSSNNVSAETLLETEKEELDSIISPSNNITETNSEPPKSQSPITTASCRRKQAKPQRKNGESYFTFYFI